MAGGAAVSLRIPILAYHSISEDPADWIAPFTVAPQVFDSHLDAITNAGARAMTISELIDALAGGPARLPERPVLVTFDDGFADFAAVAQPAMAAREIHATLYVATGYVESASGPAGDSMLDWPAVVDLSTRGVEVGAHSHSHPQLDVLTTSQASYEIGRSKALLEDHLGVPVRSFAYPHGYSSPGVRRLVREAGFDCACAVGNAFSRPGEDVFRLSRILVRSTTTAGQVGEWIRGIGLPLAPRRERARTAAWRLFRHAGVWTGVRKEWEV
jgi:peptidoglycan/xylan/chitin deacetylase (PgdA/CDA1 family)